jgi:PAS domain S-box-containing protein
VTSTPQPEPTPALEARLRGIVDALPAYIAYMDDDWRYVMANRTYEEWFGRSVAEIVGRPVAEVLGPSFANVEGYLRGALGGVTQRFETHMKTVEGDRVLSVIHLPDCDETGHVRGVIIHGHDVTARHRAEKELRLSEERLRLALSAADGVGTWDWDVSKDQVRADSAFARIYGVDPALAASGAPIAEFTRAIHPEDAERIGSAIAHAIEDCTEFAAEYRLVMGAGDVRWVSARGRCTRVDDGGHRFPGVVFDITTRKQAEQALLQTEKLAAEVRLASSIAHEINNPLESVVNLLYLVGNTSTEPEVRTYAQIAQDELARVSQITTQTLRFFKQSTLPKAIRPADLIESVVSLYRGRLSNSGIRVQQRIRGDQTGMLWEGEVRQILNNLVGNAIDAMRDGGGQLTLRARPAHNAGASRAGVLLTVADTGTGMDAETLKRIFDPFFTTKGITGTGLGLWVSQQLAQKNDGTLTVRTSQQAQRHGTVFALFLPFATEGEVSPV